LIVSGKHPAKTANAAQMQGGNLPPNDYAKLSASELQREGALRSTAGIAPLPVEPSSQTGLNGQLASSLAG
jgi:putative transposase